MSRAVKIQGNVPEELNYIGAIVSFDAASLEVLQKRGDLECLGGTVDEKSEFVHCVSWPETSRAKLGVSRDAWFLPKTLFEEKRSHLGPDFYQNMFTAEAPKVQIIANQYKDEFADLTFKVSEQSVWNALPDSFSVKETPHTSYAIPRLRRKVFTTSSEEDSVIRQNAVLGLMLVSEGGNLLPAMAIASPRDGRYFWRPYNEALRNDLRFTNPRHRRGELVA